MDVYIMAFPEMRVDLGCWAVVIVMIVKMKERRGKQYRKHCANTQISRKPSHPGDSGVDPRNKSTATLNL
jgi:hypothetical protein